MVKSPQVSLLVTTESDLLSGLALAARVVANNNFEVMLSVVSDNPPPLLKHVMQSLEELGEATARRFQVESLGTDCDALLARLAQRKGLRLLLLPGLSQLNDNRMKLLRKVHAHVVCFATHPGLASEPSGLWLLRDESSRNKIPNDESLNEKPEPVVHWLSGLLRSGGSEPQWATLESLTDAAKADAADAAAPPSGEPEKQSTEADWLLICARGDAIAAAAKLSKAAIDAAVGPVLLVRGEEGWYQRLTERVAPKLAAKYIPQMDREARRNLAQDLSTQSTLNFEFVALICASTFLASFGLVQDSAAVIIGAMLVAPLMTPILGAGLSLSQGNRPLFLSSLRTVAIGFLAATITSACFGVLLRFTNSEILHRSASGELILTHEIWSRTSPSIIDFLVGLVGGSAAAFARTRTHLSSALSGAAIAAALVPPIATAGLQIALISQDIAPEEGTTAVRNLIYGPMLLFLANMLTIMIGSSFVLWSTGIRSQHDHSKNERWATRTMVLLMLFTVAMAVWITQH